MKANHAIVHCNNEELTKEIFDLLIKNGYTVCQSSQEIETGTNGLHTVKRLDVTKRSMDGRGRYDFSLFGHIMSFNTKVIKHLQAQNCERLKDYICCAYDTFDPNNSKDHPCFDLIDEARNLLVNHGWKVYVSDWKTIGKQVIVVSPNREFYHSNFIYI